MRKGFFANWKNIKSVSIGLVYVFFTMWLIFNTASYVPAGQEDFWFKVFIGYGLLNAIIFGSADLRNKLFNLKFTDFLPRFFLFFIVSLFVFYFVLNLVDPLQESLYGILQGVPVWLAVLHALVFATTESVIWQGFLDQKIGLPWSSLVAGLFHLTVWSGGAFSVFVGASILFMLFSFVNWYFRKHSADLAPVIGCHTAYNFIKIGLLLIIGGSGLS